MAKPCVTPAYHTHATDFIANWLDYGLATDLSLQWVLVYDTAPLPSAQLSTCTECVLGPYAAFKLKDAFIVIISKTI